VHSVVRGQPCAVPNVFMVSVPPCFGARACGLVGRYILVDAQVLRDVVLVAVLDNHCEVVCATFSFLFSNKLKIRVSILSLMQVSLNT
jgi:hypothetical protein